MPEDHTESAQNQYSQSDHRTIRLDVPAMDCRWHAPTIATSLRGIDGVVEATPKPHRRAVVVTYDPTHTSEAELTAAVETSAAGGPHRSSAAGRGMGPGGGCRWGGPGW